MYHFDGDRILAQVGGLQLLEFGTGEFLTLTRRGKNFTAEQGHHGAATRARNPNQLVDGKIVILRESIYNELIDARLIQDALLGTGVGPMVIKDLEGSMLVTAEISYFDGDTPIKAQTEAGATNEYAFTAVVPPENWAAGANRFLVPG